jgi:hypothetical protein
MSKTPWKKIVSDPSYIGEADFNEGEEKILTIKSINQSETVTTAEGKSQKAVVHFSESGNKPMILNVARSKSIAKVTKSKFVEDWPGHKIQLYIEDGIKAFGDIVSAVRVRPFVPKAPAPVPPCSDCKKDIQSAMGKTAAWMAAYTEKHYGVPLCAECAAKRKAAEAKADSVESEQTQGKPPQDYGTTPPAVRCEPSEDETEESDNGNV